MKKIIYFLIFVLLSFSVLAVPPFTATTTGGLTILHPVVNEIKLGDSAYLHFHIINSTGFIKNVSQYNCALHLYGEDGNDIYGINTIPTDTLTPNNPWDKLLIVNSTLLNKTGLYSYNMWCNTTNEGGNLVSYFYVTRNGLNTPEEINKTFLPVIFSVLGILGFLMFLYYKIDELNHRIFRTFILCFSIFFAINIPRIIIQYINLAFANDLLKYYIFFIKVFVIYLIGYFIWSIADYYGKTEWFKRLIKDNFSNKGGK